MLDGSTCCWPIIFVEEVAGDDDPAVATELLEINSDAMGFKRWPLPEADVEGALEDVGPTTETIVG